MSPSFIASTAALAFGPTTSLSAANFTSCPNNSESLTATGAKDNSGFGSPFGFPKWEQRITFPPSATNFLIVGFVYFHTIKKNFCKCLSNPDNPLFSLFFTHFNAKS